MMLRHIVRTGPCSYDSSAALRRPSLIGRRTATAGAPLPGRSRGAVPAVVRSDCPQWSLGHGREITRAELRRGGLPSGPAVSRPVRRPFLPVRRPFLPVRRPFLPVRRPFLPVRRPFLPVRRPAAAWVACRCFGWLARCRGQREGCPGWLAPSRRWAGNSDQAGVATGRTCRFSGTDRIGTVADRCRSTPASGGSSGAAHGRASKWMPPRGQLVLSPVESRWKRRGGARDRWAQRSMDLVR